MEHQDYYDEEFEPQANSISSPANNRKGPMVVQGSPGQSPNESGLPRITTPTIETDKKRGAKGSKRKENNEKGYSGQSMDKLMNFSQGQHSANSNNLSKSRKNSELKEEDNGSGKYGDKEVRKGSKSTAHLFDNSGNKILRQKAQFHNRNSRKDLLLNKNYERLALRTTLMSQVEKVDKCFNQGREGLAKVKDEEVNRLNNKIREWIKRLNYDLDEKINSAIREKQLEHHNRKEKSGDELLSLLNSQMVNNEDVLKSIQKELNQLRAQGDRDDGEMRMGLHKQKQQVKDGIELTKKKIKKLKKGEEKLSEQLQLYKHPSLRSKQVEELKQKILRASNQSSSNQDYQSKLDLQMVQLQVKVKKQTADLDDRLREAKEQNISLESNRNVQSYDELKQKTNRLRTNNIHLQNISKRSCEQIQHQIKLIHNELRQYNKQFQQIDQRVSMNTTQALQLITKHSTLLETHCHNASALVFFQKHMNNENKSIYAPTSPLIRQQSKKKNVSEDKSPKSKLSTQDEDINNIKQIQKSLVENNEFIEMKPQNSPNRVWKQEDVPKANGSNLDQGVYPQSEVKNEQPEKGSSVIPKGFRRRRETGSDNKIKETLALPDS